MGDMRVEEPVVMGGMMPVPADAAAPMVPSADLPPEPPKNVEPGHLMGQPALAVPTKGTK
jgi:hypothetical protein